MSPYREPSERDVYEEDQEEALAARIVGVFHLVLVWLKCVPPHPDSWYIERGRRARPGTRLEWFHDVLFYEIRNALFDRK